MTDLSERIRGDYVLIPITLFLTDFDWTNVNVRCHIRKSVNSTGFIAQFSNTGGSVGTSTTFTTTSTGLATLLLVASGSATETWPAQNLYGDVEVSRVSPSWGPYTPVQFMLPIAADVTR